MSSILKVDTIQDQSGNNIINENADTITIGASGDTIDVPGTEIKTNKISPTSGTTLTLGDSGDTITIPSGATITNSGTATGFGAQVYGASAYRSGTQTITSGVITKVQLNAEYYDANSEFDIVTNYRYTASQTGDYYIFGGVGQNGQTGTSVIWTPYIYKNGSELIRGSQTTDYGVSYWFPVGGLITPLTATDYIELYIFHNKGTDADINGDSNTILTVLRIG